MVRPAKQIEKPGVDKDDEQGRMGDNDNSDSSDGDGNNSNSSIPPMS